MNHSHFSKNSKNPKKQDYGPGMNNTRLYFRYNAGVFSFYGFLMFINTISGITDDQN